MKILTSAQIGTRLEAAARMTGAQIGTWLERQARRVAPAVAFGYALAVHSVEQYKRISSTVAAAHAAWIGDDWRFERPAPVLPVTKPAPVQGALQGPRGLSLPLPVIAQPVAVDVTDRRPVVISKTHRAPLTVDNLIASHTQRELMEIAGTKSKRSKKVLAEKIIREGLFEYN